MQERILSLLLILMAISLFVLIIPARAVNNSATSSAATVIIFPDGWMDITLTLNLTGNESYVNVRIDGEPHYLLVEGEGWLTLNYTLSGKTLKIETLGVRHINISYQTPSLTSKIGSLWNASVSLDVDQMTLLLPKDSIILGISSVPSSIQVEDQWMRFSFNSGSVWMTYKINRAPVSPPTLAVATNKITESRNQGTEATTSESGSVAETTSGSNSLVTASTAKSISTRTTSILKVSSSSNGTQLSDLLLPIALISVIFVILILALMRRHKLVEVKESDIDSLERNIILELMRRNGQALQSDLVKALDAPRATIWRRLRKMEAEGKVELLKEGRYTVVRLKADLN